MGTRGHQQCQTAMDREWAGLTAWRPQGPCPLCSEAACAEEGGGDPLNEQKDGGSIVKRDP